MSQESHSSPVYWEILFAKTDNPNDADERIIIQANDAAWDNKERANLDKNAKYFFVYLIEQKARMGYNAFIRHMKKDDSGNFVPISEEEEYE